MKWFKVHSEKWLMGSTRWELTLEDRAIWTDFLALASLNDPPGQFSFHSLKQLSDQLKASPKKIEKAMKKFIDFKKISVDFAANSVVIANWKKYQSEYSRQKPYRSPGKEKKVCNSVTTESVTELPVEERRGEEIREEGEGEREENAPEGADLPPIPKYLDFKIQDQLREIRANYREGIRLKNGDPKKWQYQGLTIEQVDGEIARLKKSYCTLLEDFK
jgi:hypothetical protein